MFNSFSSFFPYLPPPLVPPSPAIWLCGGKILTELVWRRQKRTMLKVTMAGFIYHFLPVLEIAIKKEIEKGLKAKA